jgi:uncharacterized RDD family membrane protein YckC
MTDTNWYYIQGDGQQGPVSEADLVALQRDGRVCGQTLIWRKGLAGWGPLAELLPGISETPPPLPNGLAAPTSRPQRQQREPWSDTSPHPWRRYFARMFDLYMGGWALLFILAVGLYAVDPALGARFGKFAGDGENRFLLSLLILALGFVANVFFLGLTATTIGKWLFGIRIARADGRPMGLGTALKREFGVTASGMGLWIPIVSLVTMTGSYRTLRQQGITSWDRNNGLFVMQRPNSISQIILGLVVVVFSIVAAAILISLNAAR